MTLKLHSATPSVLPWPAFLEAFISEFDDDEEAVRDEYARLLAQDWFIVTEDGAKKYVVQVGMNPSQADPDMLVLHISIRNAENTAVRDWRDMQWIKTAIAGPDSEGVELYPAESRKVDTANQFHIWCLPPGYRFPFGYTERRVSDDESGGSKQRKGANT